RTVQTAEDFVYPLVVAIVCPLTLSIYVPAYFAALNAPAAKCTSNNLLKIERAYSAVSLRRIEHVQNRPDRRILDSLRARNPFRAVLANNNGRFLHKTAPIRIHFGVKHFSILRPFHLKVSTAFAAFYRR